MSGRTWSISSAPTGRTSTSATAIRSMPFSAWSARRQLRPSGADVSAPDLAVDVRHGFGGVDLKLRILKPRRDQGFPVFVDGDRAREAARPSVQALLEGRLERLELDHVGNGEQPTRTQDSERLLDDCTLVLREVDHTV